MVARRIAKRLAFASIVSVVILLQPAVLPASPAAALGSGSRTCYYGGSANGTIYGGSYQNSFSNAGGWTQRSACGNQVGVSLKYNAYPGSPVYQTGWSYGSTYVHRGQSGTVGGLHVAILGCCGIGSLAT